ncbi:hypothetical protein GCM10009775_32870 [Microbacterium aoyamense]|uniref:Lsr2 DNA-binding domain-containing protein n=1 Tax=Microbacterium aoyamense TaxID=344166 RepID=A0ABN2PZ94_9MICO
MTTGAPQRAAQGADGLACACGAPVYIRKSGECRNCYQSRWDHNRAKPPRECVDCARPASSPTARYCDPCRRRRAQSRRPFLADPSTYSTAHARVRRARGRAADWRCLDCQKRQAKQWAYRAGSPRERVTLELHAGRAHRHVWSPDPNDYDPLCLSCHIARDRDPRPGYRHDDARRRELRQAWSRDHYEKQTGSDDGRAKYRERKRTEKRNRSQAFEIRTWAAEHGLTISASGRLPDAVLSDWNAARHTEPHHPDHRIKSAVKKNLTANAGR